MKKFLILFLLISFNLLFFGASANATLFIFTQGGYSGGGQVSGTFEATDADGNGQISTFDGEVTSFDLTFSGDSIVGDFSHTFTELWGLVYDIGGEFLGDGVSGDIEGIGSGFAFSYKTGNGPLGIHGGFVQDIAGAISGTDQLVSVHATPIPATIILLGTGLAGLAGVIRRKNNPSQI